MEDEVDDDKITEAVGDDGEVAIDAGTAVLARAAWCLAALSLFFFLSAGPRCRGRRGGNEGGGEVAEEGGREWGAPGGPKVQENPAVVTPLLVERLRVAVPPRAQTEINSVIVPSL